MGNHTRFRYDLCYTKISIIFLIHYRLALNAMIWAAISWSCMIDPVKGFKDCTTNYHFLNYWKTDAVLVHTGKGPAPRARTDTEKVKTCIILPYLS